MFAATADVVRFAEYGADVRLLPVGSPRHLADVLNGTLSRADHLVLCCHGDERGILLDELAPTSRHTSRSTGCSLPRSPPDWWGGWTSRWCSPPAA
ncbi:hypothetical protein GCM10010417_30060 [Streptomyces carpaticus]